MHHSLLIALNILVVAEAALSILALAGCLRLRDDDPVPAMRDYLIVRAANATAGAIILLWPGEFLFASVRTSLSTILYYVWYWGLEFVQFFLAVRVIAGAMAVFFRDLPGLQKLFRVASRWVAITGVIAIIPLFLAIAAHFTDRAYLHFFHRWWYTFAAVTLIPVVLALFAGNSRKVRWSSRAALLLFGLAAEPLIDLVTPMSWTSSVSMVAVSNLLHEGGCCIAVALWAICYALPERPAPLARPTLAMFRLDELARLTLRQGRPAARSETFAQQGAQPWPKFRRDA